MHWPDPASLLLFLAVVVFVGVAFLAGVAWATARDSRIRDTGLAALGLIGWMGLTGGLAWSGVFQVAEPFLRLAPYVAITLALALGLGLSPLGRRLADHVPIALLVGFHGFRLPLEIVLHDWASQGTVPTAMSFGGQNFDILTGVLALIVVPLARRSWWLVLLFELVGVGLLLNIFRIIAGNVPGGPLYVESAQPALLLPVYFPTTWIVSICVFFAIFGHVILARWLWRRAPFASTPSEAS